jgi:protein FRA10AC1
MERQRKQAKDFPPGPPQVKNIVSEADHQALQDAYSFLPPVRAAPAEDKTNQLKDGNHKNSSSWQDRMVKRYHDHLYKEFALADLSQGAGRIGLRWRTQQEVKDGRGEITCGNKHCSKSKDYVSSATTLQSLSTLEVPFSYQEHGERKKELVKLRLCSACLDLVSKTKQPQPQPEAQDIQSQNDNEMVEESSPSSDSSDSSREHSRKKKNRKKWKKEEHGRKKKKRQRT